MPSNVSYPRKYYSTTYAELDTIPLKEGNVISLYDTDGLYYDVGNPAGSGQNVIRRKASNIEYVSSLSEARQEPTTIFVIQNATMQDEEGNTVISYSGYRWNEDSTPAKFDEIFNNLRDFKVKSTSSDSTKAYIVGSVESADTIGTLVKNPNIYLTATGNKIHAGLEGVADNATEANHAAQATLADRAINDNFSTPQPITSYIRGISSDAVTDLGTTLTITKGDGTTSAVRISNTTYEVFTENPDVPGLVNGINTVEPSDVTGLILTGSGWVDISNIVMPAAESAESDGEGQNIADTYIKDLSYNTSTELLTVTWGDGDTDTVSIPDTTYSVFTTSTDGLVPAPSGAGEGNMFLRGDQTWQPISIDPYQGATSVDDGVDGLVPHAVAGEQDYYLKGDGTWGTVFSAGVNGLVPAPSLSDAGKSLKVDSSGNGIWDDCVIDTTGTANDITHSLYLVGSTNQSTTNVTNTNQYVFIQGNRLYQSDGGATPAAVAVVDESSTQALTNKTYEGYTLGDACEGTLATTVAQNSNIPTNSAVITYVSNRVGQLQQLLDIKLDSEAVAPIYDDTATYVAGTYAMYDDGNGTRLYRCNTTISTAEDFDPTKWDMLDIINCIGFELTSTLAAGNTTLTLTDNRITTNSMIDYYTDVYGVNPTSVVVTTGQIVLTFAAQATALNVKVVVKS